MSLLGRLFGAKSQPDPAPPVLDPEEKEGLLEHLRELTAVELLTSPDPLPELTEELVHDAVLEGVPRAEAEAVVRAEWERRVRLAAEHGEEDMSAALLRAFAALERDGVLARAPLGWDNDEGHHEATEAARAAGARGYVFFHHQDATRILDGPFFLCLRYGAARHSSPDAAGRLEEDAAVGRLVAAAVAAEGLPVEWDGSAESVVQVPDMRWYAAPGPR